MVSHQRRLGQIEFKYQMMVEKKRLASELLKFQELYGDLYSEPCLICLEDIHAQASDMLMEIFPCCGGFVCKSCLRDMRESGVGLGKCPLCRESLDKTEAEISAKVMALAKRDVSWAQSHVGKCMIRGIRGFKKRAKAGLEWLNKAAAQSNPSALFLLSMYHRDGLKSLVIDSQEKANEMLVKSANLGCASANSELARFKFAGMDGFEEDIEEAYFRASVGFALDGGDAVASKTLGSCHYFEDIPEPSPYLACYYNNIFATSEVDTTGASSYFYSQSLMRLASHLFEDHRVNGSNVMPAAVFWLRKSRDLGNINLKKELKGGSVMDKIYVATAQRRRRLVKNTSNVPSAGPSGIAAKGVRSRHGGMDTSKIANALQYWSSRIIFM